MTTRMRTLIAAALTLAVLLSVGCSGKEDDTKGDGKTGDGKTADKRPKKDGDAAESSGKPTGKADFSLTSQQFSEEFKKDRAAAQKKYQSKTVDLTGVIKRFSEAPDRTALVWLEGAKGELLGVQCIARGRHPWRQALPGQTVTVRGKGAEFGGAFLLDCVFFDAKGDPPPTLTPDQLVAEHAKDPAATEKKYKDKYLILEGKVAKVTANKFDLAEVTLETAKKEPRIYLHFTNGPEGKRAKGLKAGQKIKALGQYSVLTVSKDAVGLFDSLVLEPEL